MNRHWLKKIGIEIFIIFVLSLTPLLWFKTGTILVGHDNTYPLEPRIFLSNRLSTWTENFFGHDQSFILGTIPIHFIDAIPSLLGFSLQDGQKIVYVFWFFLIGLSAYILGWTLRPQSSLFRLTAVILYQFNYFILQGWWIGEKSKFSAYIALPLLLSIVFLVSRRRISTLIGAITASLILFVFNGGGLYGIPLFGGAFVAIGMLVLFKSLAYMLARDFRSLCRLMVFCALTLVLSILMNSYFIVPAYAKAHSAVAPEASSIGGVSGVISWANQISANASYLNLFRLQGIPEWYDNPEHPYGKFILQRRIFIAISFLWPFLVFASFFVAKKTRNDRLVTYFFVVYLVGIFFAAGTHPPLGFLYQFFIEKIPGFIIFRSPYYKFAPAVFLATAYLIAYGIDSLWRKLRILASLILVVMIFVYHYPFFSGNFFTWRSQFSTRLSIPSYVYEFGNWLNYEKPDDGRVLLLPPNTIDRLYSTYNWGYLSFQAIPTLLSKKSVVINNDQLNADERAMVKALYQAIEERDDTIIQKLTRILGISYVVIQSDAISDPNSLVVIDGRLYSDAVGSSNQFIYLRTFGAWDLYALKEESVPKFFLTDRFVSLEGDIEDITSSYSFIDETLPFLEQFEGHIEEKGASRLIIPTCLTCPRKRYTTFTFPQNNIPPDSPFYQLVIFWENLRPVPKEPKAAIYHILGITFKRTSEIKEILFRRGTLTTETVDRYVQLLKAIGDNFQNLPSPREKIEVAKDIREYIRLERVFLLQTNPSGWPTVLMGRLFMEMSRLEKQLEFPELILDAKQSRVYQFTLAQDDEVEIFMRMSEFRLMVEKGDTFTLLIDNNDPRELLLTPTIVERPWVSFGLVRLPAGFHTITLLFPKLKRDVRLSSLETEFTVTGDTACFGTSLKGIASSRRYNLIVSYRNDFADNLFFYVWEKQGERRTLMNSVKLLTGGVLEKTEQVLEFQEGIKEGVIAICAQNLTQEIIEKQFRVNINEVLFPALVLYRPALFRDSPVPLSFERIAPTHYRIVSSGGDLKNKTLVFSERFDDWWELRGVKARHVRANGYANAWVIEEDISGRELHIQYRGETYFFYGKLMSLMFVVGSIVYWGLRMFSQIKRHE